VPCAQTHIAGTRTENTDPGLAGEGPAPKNTVPFNDLSRAASSGDALLGAVVRVVRSGRYLMGRETAKFESDLADYLGTRHAVCVANGTDALELALVALGCTPGQEIVTAANAGAYATIAARRRGLRVRFADVDDRQLLLTPQTVEASLSPQTKVVVVTHLYGKMARAKEIRDLCHARGIRLLEDCAQAAGARADGRLAGSIGDAGAFSFYPTKNLGALGDGGAVVTSDDEVARRARKLRQYGWEAKYEIAEDGGRNSRLDEIQAAVLRVRLDRLDDSNSRRREIVKRYAEAVFSSAIEMVHHDGDDYVAHLAVIRSRSRDEVAVRLGAQGIGTAIHYPIPDHRQAVIGAADVSLPATETAAKEVLSLPCFPELEPNEIDATCSALSQIARSLQL
jgi:aminotransferase EvaB